jgi:hypothetical protein
MSAEKEVATEPTRDELVDTVRELRETVASLRDDVRRASALPPDPVDVEPDAHAWLSVLEAPRHRRFSIPRLVLEVVFLAACATAAGVADLDAVEIAGVMLGAWALVSLAEIAASRTDRARDAILYASPPVPIGVETLEPVEDPAWYSPPAEQTMHDVAASDSTAVTRLPPRVEEIESTQIELADVTIEERPSASPPPVA